MGPSNGRGRPLSSHSCVCGPKAPHKKSAKASPFSVLSLRLKIVESSFHSWFDRQECQKQAAGILIGVGLMPNRFQDPYRRNSRPSTGSRSLCQGTHFLALGICRQKQEVSCPQKPVDRNEEGVVGRVLDPISQCEWRVNITLQGNRHTQYNTTLDLEFAV